MKDLIGAALAGVAAGVAGHWTVGENTRRSRNSAQEKMDELRVLKAQLLAAGDLPILFDEEDIEESEGDTLVNYNLREEIFSEFEKRVRGKSKAKPKAKAKPKTKAKK